MGTHFAKRVLPRVLGPAARGVHISGVWGLELAKRVLPRVLLGRGPPRGGVHISGVWGLELAKRLLWGGARSYMEE